MIPDLFNPQLDKGFSHMHSHTDGHNSIMHNVQFTVAALEVGHFSHIIIRLLLSGTSASALPLSTWLIVENCKYKYFIAAL